MPKQNPFTKFIKKNETVQVSSSGEMSLNEVALGVFTYCEEIAIQNNVDTDKVIDVMTALLKQFHENKEKMKVVVNLPQENE